MTQTSCRVGCRGILLLFCILTSGSAAAVPTEDEARTEGAGQLTQINAALSRWLELAQQETPFLVIDEDAGEVRLYQRRALLRVCPATFQSGAADDQQGSSSLPGATRLDVSLDAQALELLAHLRTLRPAGPYSRADAGPFDWERYLSDAATDRSALLLTNEYLIYASDAWDPPQPAVRLQPLDLRALFDALADGTAVVWLPPGWATGG